VLAVHCGLRQDELLGLKWADVDLEAGKLLVRHTLSLTKSGHVYEQPKNWKGRSIELIRAASETLKAHLKRQLEEIEGLGDDYQDQVVVCSPHSHQSLPRKRARCW
jgi:integrase